MKKNNLLLKIALLSVCFITASLNAIAGIIPNIAESFPNTPLYLVELMTTIPSLTSMLAILLSSNIRKLVGDKNLMVISTITCGVFGTLPFVIRQIFAMLVFRSIFGFGVGCSTTVLLAMIIYFFDGNERSQMIGLQGSVGGLGSMMLTYIAGKLSNFGWPTAFLTYLVAFVVFMIVFVFVPKVKTADSNETQVNVKVNWVYIMFYSSLSFISMLLATFFVIKCATLITLNHYGSAQDGSFLVMLISGGSLVAGAVYGNIYKFLKNNSLILFYIISAVSFFMGGLAEHIFVMMIASFILGFGFMAFVPFLQEKATKQGDKGTQTLLVLQSLGGFAAPYVGTVLDLVTSSLNMQFIICGCIYIFLSIIALLVKFD